MTYRETQGKRQRQIQSDAVKSQGKQKWKRYMAKDIFLLLGLLMELFWKQTKNPENAKSSLRLHSGWRIIEEEIGL